MVKDKLGEISNNKIGIIATIISIIAILGSLFIRILNYFNLKGYYDYFNIDLNLINISSDNTLVYYIIMFFKFIILYAAPFVIYDIIRRIVTNKKIHNNILEISSNKPSIQKLEKIFYINKDKILTVLEIFLFFYLNFFLIEINIVLDLPYKQEIHTNLITEAGNLFTYFFMFLMFKDSKNHRQEFTQNVKDLSSDTSLNDHSEKINDLDKFVHVELNYSIKRLLTIILISIFCFIIGINLSSSYSNGNKKASNQKDFIISEGNDKVIFNISTTTCILLNYSIEGTDLVIDTYHQEIVSSLNLPFSISHFDNVKIQ